MPSASSRPSEATCILLVTSAQSPAAAWEEIVRDVGARLIAVATADEAASRLASQLFAAVLIDARPPRLDGLAIAGRLRAEHPRGVTPIIFLADDALPINQIEAGYALGAVDFLSGPVSRVVVTAKLRGFVELFEARRRAVLESEQLKLLVQGTTEYAIFMLDPRGHIISWNSGAERLKGYREAEIVGEHFSKFYPQDMIDRGWPEYELKVAAAEGRFEDEGWRLRKDGSRFWANVMITALLDEQGELRGFSKVTRDMTERKRAEEYDRRLLEETTARRVAEQNAAILHEERERLRVTLGSIGDGVITTDAAGRVNFLNAIAERLTGWTSADAAGRPLTEVFQIVNESTRQPVDNPAVRAMEEGLIVGLANHTILIGRNGMEVPIDDSAAPILGADGGLVGSVLVFRDISDRKRAERQRNARLAVTQAIASAGSIREGTESVLRAVCENLDWEVGFFWVAEDDGVTLTCQSFWHREELPVAAFAEASCRRTFSKGEGMPGRVWESGHAAWIVDLLAEKGFLRLGAAAQEGLRSAFAHPIAVDDRFLGVIEFFSREREEVDTNTLEMIGTIAGAVGQFLERRRAEERLREQTATAESLLAIGNLLADELDIHRLVQLVTDEGTRLCGAQFGAFFYNVIGNDGESYTLYTLSGAPREAFANFAMPRNTALFGPTFRGEGPVRCDDVTQDPRFGQNPPHAGMPRGHLPVKSYLAVPVISRGGAVLGGLFLGHPDAGVFTAYHERLLASIAGQAAVAIEGAREYQRAQASAERLNLALSAADLGDWSWDAESDLVTLSERAAEVFDIPSGPRMSWTDMQTLLHEEDRERARKEVARVIAEHEQYDIEYRVRRPDGRQVWVGVLGRAVYDAEDKVVGMFGVLQDVTRRKFLEESLRESENKLRLLADTIPQLAWMAQPDGHIFWYNRRWYDYTGTTPEMMEGWGWQSVHDPRTLPDVLERWKHSIVSGTAFEMVFPLRGADGSFRLFLTRVSPLRDEAGHIQYWFGTNTDVTELRQAREALADSEERLRLALDAGRMGVWDWNIRTGDLKWSDSLEPLHGLAPGTFGGTFEDFQRLIHPQDREAVAAAIRRALDNEAAFEVEFRNVWPSGEIHWIVGTGKVFPGEDGLPLRMIGVGMDVTQRKRAEQTAKFLADASAALAVIVDFDSTLQKVASLAVPRFADWAVIDVVEADNTLRRVAVAHSDPALALLLRELHNRMVATGNPFSGSWHVIRTQRAELIAEFTDQQLAETVNDPQALAMARRLKPRSYMRVPLQVRGKTIGAITFVTEATHRYDANDLAVAEDLANRAAIAIENAQLYRELRDADQRKDEFLATLAHELRNPLAPIRNGLEVLRLEGDKGALAYEARQMMERQLSQMIRLVDDLLDVSRITRNKLELRKERVALASVIQGAVETSRPAIEKAGHTFSLTLSPKPILLDADPVRLAQVFSNLLNNSAKYMDRGGTIHLRAELENGAAVVRVKDTGLGIPKESLPHIFEMFSQVDQNLNRAQGGLGIGLTLVRRLVEMHGGHVEAYSDGPGMGSEFVVTIPLPQDLQLEARRDMTTRGSAGETKRRILVVDDNRDSATSLAMMLRLMGNEVRTAEDGQAAVDMAQEFLPDLILLDIGLPKLNGYEACRKIRDEPWSKNMMIVALTGWGQEEDRRRSQAAGFDHHLVKPLDIAQLNKLLATPK